MRHYRLMQGVGRPSDGDPPADAFLTDPQAWAAQTLDAHRRKQRASFWRRGLWRYIVLGGAAAFMGVGLAQVAWGGTALRLAMLVLITCDGALCGMIVAIGGLIPPVSVEIADDPLPERRMLLGAVIGMIAPLLVLLATGGLSLIVRSHR